MSGQPRCRAAAPGPGLAAAALLALLAGCSGGGDDGGPTVFTVTVENVSAPGALEASDGSRHDILLAPGAWAAYAAGAEGALFEPGGLASEGLRALAEDGDNSVILSEVRERGAAYDRRTFGAVDEGVTYEENPIGPGTAVSFDVEAEPGARLSFASMFVQSNDTFVAPAGASLALFDDEGAPIEGEVTDRIRLWDAGTEVNEEPGLGDHQAPRQDAAGAGEDESEPIAPIEGSDSAGHAYPAVADFLRVRVATGAR